MRLTCREICIVTRLLNIFFSSFSDPWAIKRRASIFFYNHVLLHLPRPWQASVQKSGQASSKAQSAPPGDLEWNFSRSILYVSCKTILRNGIVNSQKGDGGSFEPRSKEASPLNKPRTASWEIHEKCFKVVKRYKKYDTTFLDDKLPTLSGLASLWAKVTGDLYLAGLWEKSIAF